MSSRPKLLILGAQKAGTTTLFDILSSHRSFGGSSIKEIHFFDQDVHFKKGLEWYLSFFPHLLEDQIGFEATPAYLYKKSCPQRIYETLGTGVKFIVMLRNPIERAYSHWNMFRKFNANQDLAHHIYNTFTVNTNEHDKCYLQSLLFAEQFPSFFSCVEFEMQQWNDINSPFEEPSFLKRGLYSTQIRRYLNYYDISNFLFIEMSELNLNLDNVLQRIHQFMGVGNVYGVNTSIKVSNKGEYLQTEQEEYMSVLSDFYKPYNEELFELIQKRYPW